MNELTVDTIKRDLNIKKIFLILKMNDLKSKFKKKTKAKTKQNKKYFFFRLHCDESNAIFWNTG